MIRSAVTLTDTVSPLGRLYDQATRHFLFGIDPAVHTNAYVGTHPRWFAESEFAGKYLDTCVRYAELTGSPEAADHARLVAESVIRNQREDGYVGGLEPGNELEAFSVWNQAFTLLGMLSWYDYSHAPEALICAEKIALWVSEQFMNGADILSGGNNGSQHLSFLLPLVRLCKVSGDPRFPAFVRHIVGKIKGSDNDFFHFDSLLGLRSKKGIENFVILIGILEYGEVFGDPDALPACIRYWEELEKTQIRENGNGTIKELWMPGGNRPQLLDLSVRPDENCVAVGWIEFSLALFFRTGDVRCLEAAERSIYNHLCGALDADGRDFAYYQPNFGRRVTRTAESMYKCCRYRGYSAVSILPQILFSAEEDTVSALFYTGARYSDDRWTVTEETGYPMTGDVRLRISVSVPGARTFRLRVPRDAETIRLSLNGEDLSVPVSDGWLSVSRMWEAGEYDVSFTFSQKLSFRCAEIDGVPRVSASYGCLLLAAETEEAAEDGAWDTLAYTPGSSAVQVPCAHSRISLRTSDGTLLSDYASSGRDGREFTVWARAKQS